MADPLRLTITPVDPPDGVLGAPPGVDPFTPQWKLAQAGDDYARIRAQRSRDAIEEEARRRHGIARPDAGASATPAAAPPDARTAGSAPPAAPPPPPVMPPTSGAPLGPGAAPIDTSGVNLEGIPAAAGAVAQDLGRGVVQAPRALAGGAADAVREIAEAGSSFGGWLAGMSEQLTGWDGKVPLPDPVFDALSKMTAGVWSPDFFKQAAADPLEAFAGLVPRIERPDSVSGGLVHDVTQFLVGFAAAGKALKAAGAATSGTGPALARGALSDALAFDPNEDNLAAVLKKHAGLQGPVTEFLATDPNDAEAVNRLRRAVEGLGLGVATEGFIAALRAYRGRRWAKAQDAGGTVDQAKAELDRLRQQHGSLDADAFSGLGDAADTGPLVRVEPQPLAAARVDRKAGAALEATDAGVPDDVTARGVAGAAAAAPPPPFATLQGRFEDALEAAGRTDRPGVAVDLPTLDKDGSFFSIIRGADGRAIGQVVGTIKDGQVRIRTAGILEAAQGGGQGVRAYRALADMALERGLVLASDREVSEPAARVYEALRRRGYSVEQAPDAAWQTRDGARHLVAKSPGPVFRVTAGPPRPPAPPSVPVPQGIARVAGDGPRLIVNFARIATPDDVKAVLRDSAEAFKGDIDAARRGVQSHEDTKALADALGLTVDDLLARRKGQPMNAEEALAARRLWVASTEKLLELSRVAAAPNAGAVDMFNFRRMLATHYAIQAEVIAARTETARALNAWKIPAAAAGDIERSRAVTEALVASGGDKTARDIARKLATLSDSGAAAKELSGFVRKTAFAKTYDAYAEFYINALLSSPKTHIVNTTSNAMALLTQVYERRLAEALSKLRGPDGVVAGVAPGEAQAMLYGLVAANRDAWRLGWLALKEGQQGQALGKVDAAPRRAAISAEAFGMQDGALARTVDWLGVATRAPTRLLGAEDEFFKAIGYRMELHALALRTARAEGLEGVELRERIADIVRDPPESIRLRAVDAATYATFTSYAGDFAEAVIRARDAVPFAGVYLLPFVKTPVNIFKYSFERTPLWMVTKQWKDDIAAGGARADIALARMATGTSIMLAAFDYADRGLVTGGLQGDPAKREVQLRQGMQRYSIRVGDQWVGYNRLDPFGLLMGFASDAAEIAHRYEIDGEKLDEFGEILAAATGAVSAAAIDKTFLQGMSNFFAMMEDPKRDAFNYAGQIAGSNVPALANALKQLDDPVVREKMQLLDYAQARLVAFSKGLTPRRDLWGAPVVPASGFGAAFDAVSPAQVGTAKISPIDAEMQRLNLGIERIDRRASFDGVAVNFRDFPLVYDAYVRLAGNELKLPLYDGKGAKDFLDGVVGGTSPWSEIYNSQSDGPDGGKAEFIRGVVAQYRKAARQELLSAPDYADFQAAFDKLARDERARRFIGGQLPDAGAQLPAMTPPRLNPSPLRQDVPGASGAPPSPADGVRIR